MIKAYHSRIPIEICLLVEHHKDILWRKFPNYGYEVYEWPEYWLRIDIRLNDCTIFIASFSFNCVQFSTSSSDFSFIEEINYSDPRFTDDMLPDMLRRLLEREGHE